MLKATVAANQQVLQLPPEGPPVAAYSVGDEVRLDLDSDAVHAFQQIEQHLQNLGWDVVVHAPP